MAENRAVDHGELISRASDIVDQALGPQAADIDVPAALRRSDTIAGRIDHTLLKADATSAAVEKLCTEAREHGFASVCVNGRWVSLASRLLKGTDVMVCTVVGFPLGATTRRAKTEEARIAVSEGATEIDMVMDVGGLLSGDLPGVYQDIAGVVAGSRPAPVKVILETCLLDDEQKAIGCLIALRAGAAYVKTSTGFGCGGATTNDVALMRAVVGDRLGVKASGGIRSREDADAMIAAGADRVGASASVAIVAGD